MESGEKVSECDLVLRHEVVHDHLPFPERVHIRCKEVWTQEQIKDLLSPGLSGDLEPTQGGQEFGTMHIALLVLRARGEGSTTIELEGRGQQQLEGSTYS